MDLQRAPILLIAAIFAIVACSGSSSSSDGGTGGGSAGRIGTGGSGGRGGGAGGEAGGKGGAAGASSSETGGAGGSSGGGGGAGAAGATGVGGSGGAGGGDPCRLEGQSCSQTQSCCGPLICIGLCTTGVSDRNAKRDFAPVSCEQILQSVATLPISTWSYKAEEPAARHIGPMAQDFMATFHVGSSDKMIYPLDANGVAFAAIQALDAKVLRLERENARLARRLDKLGGSSPRGAGMGGERQ